MLQRFRWRTALPSCSGLPPCSLPSICNAAFVTSISTFYREAAASSWSCFAVFTRTFQKMRFLTASSKNSLINGQNK